MRQFLPGFLGNRDANKPARMGAPESPASSIIHNGERPQISRQPRHLKPANGWTHEKSRRQNDRSVEREEARRDSRVEKRLSKPKNRIQIAG